MNKIVWKLDTGGGCTLYYKNTGKTDEQGRSIITVWDNWTGKTPVNVSVKKYAGSFHIGNGEDVQTFYLSEFSPVLSKRTGPNYPGQQNQHHEGNYINY